MSNWSPKARDDDASFSLTSNSNVEPHSFDVDGMTLGSPLSQLVGSGTEPWEIIVVSFSLQRAAMFGSSSSAKVGTIETYSN